MKRLIIACAAGLFNLVCTSTVAAQGVQFGIGTGLTVPLGIFRTTNTIRENVLGTVAVGSQESFVGLRFDYLYNDLGGRSSGGIKNRTLHIGSATANLVFTIPLFLYVKPYLIGGGGWYHYDGATEPKAKNEAGANGGLGFTFPCFGTDGFLEARYHRIYGPNVSKQIVPITFGLLF